MSILAKTCPMLNKLKDKMQGKISQTDLDATTRYDLHTRLAVCIPITRFATVISDRVTLLSAMTA